MAVSSENRTGSPVPGGLGTVVQSPGLFTGTSSTKTCTPPDHKQFPPKHLPLLPAAPRTSIQMPTHAQGQTLESTGQGSNMSGNLATTKCKFNANVPYNQLISVIRCETLSADLSSIAVGEEGLGTGGYCAPSARPKEQFIYCCELESYFTINERNAAGMLIPRPSEDVKFPRCSVMINDHPRMINDQ